MVLCLRGQVKLENGGERKVLGEGDLALGDDSYENELKLLATTKS